MLFLNPFLLWFDILFLGRNLGLLIYSDFGVNFLGLLRQSHILLCCGLGLRRFSHVLDRKAFFEICQKRLSIFLKFQIFLPCLFYRLLLIVHLNVLNGQ